METAVLDNGPTKQISEPTDCRRIGGIFKQQPVIAKPPKPRVHIKVRQIRRFSNPKFEVLTNDSSRTTLLVTAEKQTSRVVILAGGNRFFDRLNPMDGDTPKRLDAKRL